MRKYIAVLLAIILTLTAGGCVGNETASTTTTSSVMPSTTITPEKTTTSTTQPRETTTTTKEITIGDLLSGIDKIRSVRYTSKTFVFMNVTVKSEGISQKEQVNLSIIEQGYLNFEKRRAWINVTTVSLPDGASTNVSKIIVEDRVYLITPIGTVEDFGGSSDPVWSVNIVNLARRYLKGEASERREENGELILIYELNGKDAEELVREYVSTDQNGEVEVKDGTILFRFREGKLVGGMIQYTALSKVTISDPSLGTMEIVQEIFWRGEVKVEGINEDIEINPPT